VKTKVAKNIVVETVKWQSIEEQYVELVERKGLGHPDTIADATAEESSRALSRYYLEKYGCACVPKQREDSQHWQRNDVWRRADQTGRARPHCPAGLNPRVFTALT